MQWEQSRLDPAVADAFGFHALQIGLPGIQALRANRMPHRWIADMVLPQRSGTSIALPPMDPAFGAQQAASEVALCCDFDALPFPSHSVDLVVMPHSLELTHDPHLTLREVERVLVAEGRLVITGFNPASLWGLRQQLGHLRRRVGWGRDEPLFLPDDRGGELIGYRRLRDWLRLLGFEVESGSFGIYGPPMKSQRMLDRFSWLERLGDRWWPVLGSAYMLVAVKRVRGMRLVGMARRERRRVRNATAVVNREVKPVTHRE